MDWLNFWTVKRLKTIAIYWWASLPIMTLSVNSWGQIYRLLNHDLTFYCKHNQLCATVKSQCLEYLGYLTLHCLNYLTWWNSFRCQTPHHPSLFVFPIAQWRKEKESTALYIFFSYSIKVLMTMPFYSFYVRNRLNYIVANWQCNKFYGSSFLTIVPVHPNYLFQLGTIQVLRQQRGGWGQQMAIFADLQYYLCWRRWVDGPKKAKNMLT